VLEKFEGVKGQDHFAVLEVEPDAGPDKIKDAYFRLAKRFHPDAHHREAVLEDVRDKLEAVFIRLGEAYDVLRNPRARASYESSLKTRAPTAPPPVAAAAPSVADPPSGRTGTPRPCARRRSSWRRSSTGTSSSCWREWWPGSWASRSSGAAWRWAAPI
jgi:curved DNA-binding protein CbpA